MMRSMRILRELFCLFHFNVFLFILFFYEKMVTFVDKLS